MCIVVVVVVVVVVAVVSILRTISFYIHFLVFSNSMWQYSLYSLTFVKCNDSTSLSY